MCSGDPSLTVDAETKLNLCNFFTVKYQMEIIFMVQCLTSCLFVFTAVVLHFETVGGAKKKRRDLCNVALIKLNQVRKMIFDKLHHRMKYFSFVQKTNMLWDTLVARS